MNIFEKIQCVRNELLQRNLKMTGWNPHCKFNYFELSDIIPAINEIETELEIISICSFSKEEAKISIINLKNEDEHYSISIPFAPGRTSGGEAQDIGAGTTYMRRYLYLALYNIIERDSLDLSINKDDTNPTKGQNKMKMLFSAFENLYALKNKFLSDPDIDKVNATIAAYKSGKLSEDSLKKGIDYLKSISIEDVISNDSDIQF